MSDLQQEAIARLKLMGLCLVDAQMQDHVDDAVQSLVEHVRNHPGISRLRVPETNEFVADLYLHARRVVNATTAMLVINEMHEAGHQAMGEHDEQAANLLRSVFPEGEVGL